MTDLELQYEIFTRRDVEFELRGVRGDWGLHVTEPNLFFLDWDGYINHYPTKADAKYFAGEFLKHNKPRAAIAK